MPNEPVSTGWTISFFCPGTIGVTKALGGGDMQVPPDTVSGKSDFGDRDCREFNYSTPRDVSPDGRLTFAGPVDIAVSGAGLQIRREFRFCFKSSECLRAYITQ